MDKTVYLALTIFFSVSLLAGTGISFAANDNRYTIQPLVNEVSMYRVMEHSC